MSNIQKQHKISPAIAWLTIQKFIIFYCPLDGEHTKETDGDFKVIDCCSWRYPSEENRSFTDSQQSGVLHIHRLQKHGTGNGLHRFRLQ